MLTEPLKHLKEDKNWQKNKKTIKL
jgi:hypothetical protein